MITPIALSPEPVVAFPKPDGRMLLNQFFQCAHQGTVILWNPLIPEYRAGHVHDPAGLAYTQFLVHQQFYYFPFVTRPPYFFSSTFLIASFSSVRLATIRLRRLFSSSSSFLRFTSLASIPPYFAFQL